MSDDPIVEWARLRAPQLRTLCAESPVVIIPTASTEQHGPHLPVMTDARIGQAVAIRAARKSWDKRKALVLPVQFMGLSEHHMPYGGTLTLDHETYGAILGGLVRSVQRHGIKDVLISNSHGGNIIANQMFAEKLAMSTGMTIVAANYSREAAAEIAALLDDQPGIQHACEAETSMMMALEPDLVDGSDLAALNSPRKAFLSAGKGAFRWRPFTHMTASGVAGHPEKATLEKGRAIFRAAADGIAAVITDPDSWAPPDDMRA
ncbi:MAG: creatininase family protein [Pseudomonadota bacterium]